AFGWDQAEPEDTFANNQTELIGTREELSPPAVEHESDATDATGDMKGDVGVSRAGLDGPGGSERGTSERMVGPARETPAAPEHDPDDDDFGNDNPTEVVKR